MKQAYNAPLLIIENFEFDTVYANNSAWDEEIKNGHGANNQNCWGTAGPGDEYYIDGKTNSQMRCTQA